ncbi:unnamed protein product [Prunus armeniaca]
MVNGKLAREVIQIHWSPPTAARSKLSVDGSYKTTSWKITTGGLLRDSHGSWICGFSVNIGIGNIAKDCKSLQNCDWSYKISHVYRKQNRTADHLANLGYELTFGLHNFELALTSILNILLDDVLGRAL